MYGAASSSWGDWKWCCELNNLSHYRKTFFPQEVWFNASPLVNGTEVLQKLNSIWEGQMFTICHHNKYRNECLRANQACFWLWQEPSSISMTWHSMCTCELGRNHLKSLWIPHYINHYQASDFHLREKNAQRADDKMRLQHKSSILHKLLNRNLMNNTLCLADISYCQDHVVGFTNHRLPRHLDVGTAFHHWSKQGCRQLADISRTTMAEPTLRFQVCCSSAPITLMLSRPCLTDKQICSRKSLKFWPCG